jgi:hypothetical protein
MSNIESSRERRTSTYPLMSIAPNVAFRRHIYCFHKKILVRPLVLLSYVTKPHKILTKRYIRN